MRRAATNGSDAVPMTSMSGSADRIAVIVWRADAGASTMRTRTLRGMMMLSPAEHGGSHRFQRQMKAGERFRVAEKQEAADAQMFAQVLQHGLLRFLIKINKNVAAEDDVHRSEHSRIPAYPSVFTLLFDLIWLALKGCLGYVFATMTYTPMRATTVRYLKTRGNQFYYRRDIPA